MTKLCVVPENWIDPSADPIPELPADIEAAVELALEVLAGKWRDDSGRYIQPAIVLEIANALLKATGRE